MKFPSIRIEGSILASDILDKIESSDVPGQKPGDFGLPLNSKVKDEIARAWADGQDLWRIFRRRLEGLKEGATATTETRNLWITPLLQLLGYQLEAARKGEEVLGKNYFISHRIPDRDNFSVHIMGWRDSLDRKREDSGPRMSPHALVQEYLNLTEHLYAIVTNGQQLRLLRDSSRLIKLSFLEFDLRRMFEEGLFSDFALFYRLLHVSRMPVKQDAAAESIIERYHQDSLESGSRIRDGLSVAVEKSIVALANGFLTHPENNALREAVKSSTLQASDLYQCLLRLIYRILFLMVIEERDLIYPKKADRKQRDIYYRYYSIQRLRRLGEKRFFAERQFEDAWQSLNSTFRLFEAGGPGQKLGIAPLAGDLFDTRAVGLLNSSQLDNNILLNSFRNLSLFQHPDTKQWIRVNYGALNVEEFGSVYEGLLKREAVLQESAAGQMFELRVSDDETQSHYTPDELAQPLIQHSLDHVIDEKLKEKDKEKALLSIRVLDLACGSGHILLNAARRIATELAVVRTREDQPSPSAFREAVRDVIRHCIYGVDVNPLAVELCKVALWLEAHVPGESLNFLDHHIKCGNAIVGLAHEKDLERGIPDEAFKTLAGDEKEVASAFRKTNKLQREECAKAAKQIKLDLTQVVRQELQPVSKRYAELADLPDHTPEDYANKQFQFEEITGRRDLWRLRTLANLQTAQFFIRKTTANRSFICTEEEYRDYLTGKRHPQSQAAAQANALWAKNHWFHWFIEFPDIIERGGFDCILGNPPFLGGQRLSGTYGDDFLNWVKTEFAPAGSVDLVTYFFRRIFELLRPNGFQALISTNTIAQGNAREGGLEVLLQRSATINFAIRSLKWPGRAAVEVSLIAIHKGAWQGPIVLDRRAVRRITAFLDDAETLGDPERLARNADLSFQGSIVLGKGFILDLDRVQAIRQANPRCSHVLFPYLNGEDLNSSPDQSPSRWIINFKDWPRDKAETECPECFRIVQEKVKPERDLNEYSKKARECWWLYERLRPELYKRIANLERVLVVAQVSKTVAFAFVTPDKVLDAKLIVFAIDDSARFAVLQSSIHYNWAWKYCTTMKADLSYGPTRIFETFPFPALLASELSRIGEQYYECRRGAMLKLGLGLTKTYNLFHDQELSVEVVRQETKQVPSSAESCYRDLLQLRTLHTEMDEAVIAAYGWHEPSDAGPAITLRHGFYEMEYLPENDRIRYTIHPDARREILKRLLQLNHKLHAEEQLKEVQRKKTPKKESAPQPGPAELPLDLDLFGRATRNNTPTGLRHASAEPQIYALNLIVALLSEAGGSLSWSLLASAFVLTVRPNLMKEHANPDEKREVETWASRYNEKASEKDLIPAIKLLGSRNLHFEPDGELFKVQLQDGPRNVEDPEIIYDAKLALKVMRQKTNLNLKEVETLRKEAAELVAGL